MENGIVNGSSGDQPYLNGHTNRSDEGSFLFTSESVAEGHPGKMRRETRVFCAHHEPSSLRLNKITFAAFAGLRKVSLWLIIRRLQKFVISDPVSYFS